MVDRFPEAFERFKRVVDTRYFDSYDELYSSFRLWAGKRWRNTWAQNRGLAREAEKLGFRDIKMPRMLGFTVKTEKMIKARRKRKVTWIKAYEKTAKRTRKAVVKKYKGIGKVGVKALSWYVSRGYSANKIQKRMKDRGLGIRRKKLLKIVREMRLRAKKAKVTKYIPKKYRKKKR